MYIDQNRVTDPEIIFKNFSMMVTFEIVKIEKKYSSSYEEITAYLKSNEPEIIREIENYYDLIDSDIYRKHRDGDLAEFELDLWEESLKQWELAIKKGLKKFSDFKDTISN